MTLHSVTLGGTRDEAPVIVVNGGPGASHDSVARLARLAAAGVHVVAYDQRGVGGSSSPSDDARYALADQVTDLDAVRASLGAQRVALVGHSFGGLIAMAYAAAHPDRVTALVLVAPMAPDWKDAQAAGALLEARVKALGAAGKLAEPPSSGSDGDDCRRASNAVLPALFFDPDYPRTHDTPESRATQCSARVQSATFAALEGYDVRPGLAAFRAPTLIVVGAGDPFGDGPSRAAAAALAGATPDVARVPGAGHFPWIEAATAFDDAVVPFLRTHARGG